MNTPSIGNNCGRAKARLGEARSCSCNKCCIFKKRIEPEGDAHLRGCKLARGQNFFHCGSDRSAMRPGIDLDGQARLQHDAFERLFERIGIGRQTEAIGSARSRKDDMQTIRAIFQIAQRLFMGSARIGIVDAGQLLPCAGMGGGNRCGRFGPRIEGRNGKAVVAFADELFEWRALQHMIDEFAPLRLVDGWKGAGKGRLKHTVSLCRAGRPVVSSGLFA